MSSAPTRRDVLWGGAAAAATWLAPGCRRQPAASSSAPADAGPPRRGGRVRIGIIEGAQAGNLDAHKPLGGGTIRGWALYAKLWEWSPDVVPTPALAEHTEVNADASTWTMRLRPGLEFHHGKSITADDVIFSILRLTDPQLASPYARMVGPVDRARVRKLDARTVRVSFERDQGFVPLDETWISFGGIVPTDYHPVKNPVGAGPFRLAEFVPGERARFTRFENYFKPGQPYLDELELVEFKDHTARLAALQAGQIDVAGAIPSEHVGLVRAIPSASLVVSRTNGWHSFDMNLDKPPFDDARVRQAFRLLVDRRELVERALQGYGRVANDLYAPHDPTYNHEIPQRERDLEQARALLKRAGVAGSTVELTTTPGLSASGALIFERQAAAAGINVKVTLVDAATFTGPRRDSWTLSTGGIPARGFLASGIHVDAPIAIANKTHFRDARFGELFTQALAQPAVAARATLVHEAQRIQHERGGLIIWGFADILDAVSRQVGGIEPEATQFAAWRFDKLWRRQGA